MVVLSAFVCASRITKAVKHCCFHGAKKASLTLGKIAVNTCRGSHEENFSLL